eukprot:Awhi_evm1s3542
MSTMINTGLSLGNFLNSSNGNNSNNNFCTGISRGSSDFNIGNNNSGSFQHPSNMELEMTIDNINNLNINAAYTNPNTPPLVLTQQHQHNQNNNYHQHNNVFQNHGYSSHDNLYHHHQQQHNYSQPPPLHDNLDQEPECDKPVRIRRSAKQLTRPYVCTYPGCQRRYEAHRALKLHVKQKHSMTLTELAALVESDKNESPPACDNSKLRLKASVSMDNINSRTNKSLSKGSAKTPAAAGSAASNKSDAKAKGSAGVSSLSKQKRPVSSASSPAPRKPRSSSISSLNKSPLLNNPANSQTNNPLANPAKSGNLNKGNTRPAIARRSSMSAFEHLTLEPFETQMQKLQQSIDTDAYHNMNNLNNTNNDSNNNSPLNLTRQSSFGQQHTPIGSVNPVRRQSLNNLGEAAMNFNLFDNYPFNNNTNTNDSMSNGNNTNDQNDGDFAFKVDPLLASSLIAHNQHLCQITEQNNPTLPSVREGRPSNTQTAAPPKTTNPRRRKSETMSSRQATTFTNYSFKNDSFNGGENFKIASHKTRIVHNSGISIPAKPKKPSKKSSAKNNASNKSTTTNVAPNNVTRIIPNSMNNNDSAYNNNNNNNINNINHNNNNNNSYLNNNHDMKVEDLEMMALMFDSENSDFLTNSTCNTPPSLVKSRSMDCLNFNMANLSPRSWETFQQQQQQQPHQQQIHQQLLLQQQQQQNDNGLADVFNNVIDSNTSRLGSTSLSNTGLSFGIGANGNAMPDEIASIYRELRSFGSSAQLNT